MTIAINTQGDYVEISAINSGLQSDCFCISCKRQLVAKKGEVKQHHFSHHTEDIRDCNWSKETELHVKTKILIASINSIDVPIGLAEKKIMSVGYGPSKCEVGVPGSRYVADVKSSIDDDVFYFEIMVTHSNDPEKTTYYKSKRLNAIELDMSGYFFEFDTINDEHIETFINKNAKSHKWLSINPNGFIGELFYQHYLELIRNAKVEHQSLKDEGASLKSKNNSHQEFNRRLSKRKTDLTAQIYKLENSDLIERQSLMLKSISDRQLSMESYYNNYIFGKMQEISSLQEKVDFAIQNLDDDLAKRFQAGMTKIEYSLKAKQIEVEKKWVSEFEKNNEQELKVFNDELSALESKRQLLLIEMNDLSAIINDIDERESTIQLAQADLRPAMMAYNSASRHIQYLTKELRPIARKSGIPWPIDDESIDILKKAGSSSIFDKILNDFLCNDKS